jgi:hypothetical protein
MACNGTGYWVTGGDFHLTTDEVCTVHQNTFRAIWFVIAFLHLTLTAHATSKLPLDVGQLRRLVLKGAPRTLPLWILFCGVLGFPLYPYKAATLWFFTTDHTLLAYAMLCGIFFGPVVWSFLFALVAPFLKYSISILNPIFDTTMAGPCDQLLVWLVFNNG